ncbi:helix-turn-helix domain-containing protein [Streptosporangium sp. NPDC049376]|uniref:helix-turn-helix domain-containing protein n=1 Tax=Streptosporangium sp. NPDC049376 TaxID=3366192 RepID=UPI0037A3A934
MQDQSAEARKAFGIRLRDLRRDAGLNGRKLADLTGMHPTKVSRIEHARQNPSEQDIRDWCIACGVEGLVPELIAVYRDVRRMWQEYRTTFRTHSRQAVQARGTPLYERTKLLRVYEAIVVPGILQTVGYSRGIQTISAMLHDLPMEGVEGAVQARLGKQRFLTGGTAHMYSFVIEAAVLTYAYGDMDAMNEQFDFLSRVTRLPNVAFGIIPPGFRKIWGGECFYMFDSGLVRSEMWSGRFQTTRAEDLAYFMKVFTLLQGQAVYGDEARALIEQARDFLQSHEIS